jgi:hypothetical protein
MDSCGLTSGLSPQLFYQKLALREVVLRPESHVEIDSPLIYMVNGIFYQRRSYKWYFKDGLHSEI